jgi:membrane protease YdiL (CAAX protease family)
LKTIFFLKSVYLRVNRKPKHLLKRRTMEKQAGWKAPAAVACYVMLLAGILVGSILVVTIILGLGIDYQELPFPSSILSLPITEGIILGITLLFARQKGATLRDLGVKKPRLKTVLVVTATTILLILLAMSISVIEDVVLGPDPMAEELLRALLPQDSFQLLLLVGISIFLVGPAEEIAFRGFIQRGFENSYGKTVGLAVASVLFGLLHGLNSLRSIVPVTVLSLFLGYVWQKTNYNTTASAWMHGLYDAITITVAYLATLGI